MELKTIDIKGKAYVEVNERIKAFWKLYPEGRIETKLLSIENGTCIMKAEAYKDKANEKPDATGTAYEQEGSTFINKTSYIENCETSAIGRCLGILGIGIDTSVASAEEVENAMENQRKLIEAVDSIGITLPLIKEMVKFDSERRVLSPRWKYKAMENVALGLSELTPKLIYGFRLNLKDLVRHGFIFDL